MSNAIRLNSSESQARHLYLWKNHGSINHFGFHKASVTAVLLVIYLVYRIFIHESNNNKRPYNNTTKTKVIIIGQPKSFSWLFPGLRSRIKCLIGAKHLFQDGYDRYHKVEEPFSVKTWTNTITILPSKYMDEVKNADEKILNTNTEDEFMIKYSMPSVVKTEHYHIGIIKKDLTRSLTGLVPTLIEEAGLAMNRYFDELSSPGEENEEWRKLPVWSSMLKIVAQTSNRIFVGEPLCREQKFLDACVGYASALFPTSEALKMVPGFLRPLLAPLITYPMHRYRNIAHSYLEPVMRQRMEDMKKLGYKEPNDMLQWVIRDAPKYKEDNMTDMITRVMVSEFTAIHTTAMSMTNALYDLAYLSHSDLSIGVALRNELFNTLPSTDKLDLDKQTIQLLPILDAFMKETARLHNVGPSSIHRRVVNRNGWTTQDGRLTFPYGCLLAFPGMGLHQDSALYDNANQHDWTRFYSGNLKSEKNEDKGVKRYLDRHIVSTANEFVVFGGGKHACPGRFFAANEMRIMMANFLFNWDVKPIETRPSPQWLGTLLLCNMKAKLEIRRRKPAKHVTFKGDPNTGK